MDILSIAIVLMVCTTATGTGLHKSTNSRIDVGEELQTSYGSHSNDVLLCECTFDLVHKLMKVKYPEKLRY